MVSSDVQADPVAYLKKPLKSGKERVKAALRVALFLSGDISCTDTGRGTPAAFYRRLPNQKPAGAGKTSTSPSEVLRPAAAASRPCNKMFLSVFFPADLNINITFRSCECLQLLPIFLFIFFFSILISNYR